MNKQKELEARKIIVSWLKQMREDKLLTQQELADLIGCDHTTVSKIESGKWAFSIDYINRLAEHLDFYIFLCPKNSKDELAQAMKDRWGKMKEN